MATGMADLSGCYQQGLGAKHELDKQVAVFSPSTTPTAVQQRIAALLGDARRHADGVSLRVARGEGGALWQKRSRQLAQDVGELERWASSQPPCALAKCFNRAALLGASASGEGPPPEATDAMLRERDGLKASLRMIDEQLEHGLGILDQMTNQNSQLRSIKGKVGTALESLGLSQTLSRVIQRRTREDTVMVYALMVGTLLFFVAFWWWWKWT